MLNAYYLDAANEKATKFILHSLGVQFESSLNDKVSNKLSISFSNMKDFDKERRSNYSFHVQVTAGELLVDLRDSSNCWIRTHVQSGQFLTISANLYHRFTLFSEDTKAEVSSMNPYEFVSRYTEDIDSIEIIKYHKYRELVCELCVQFFHAGWVTGTGGSISIRHGNRIYMTPSGVQKERINPEELFVLDVDGNILSVPSRKPDFISPKLSDCSSLFLHAYKQRNAGAVLHSHSFCANLITSLFEGKSEYRISHQEMIKALAGYGYFDELVIPIIENTAWEHELSDKLGETIAKYPKAVAVLVRRHGMYVWGNSWEQAKRHAEALHYLFEVTIRMRQLGLDYTKPPIEAISEANSMIRSNKRGNDHHVESLKRTKPFYKYVIFDIEGTTTPITFVKDVLFPYAARNIQSFLEETWNSKQTQEDISLLKLQLEADLLANNNTSLLNFPKHVINLDDINSVCDYVTWNIELDRKVTSLKQIQGHIWERGYDSGKLKSIVYDDVPIAFERLSRNGSKIGIYSSGSRNAQKLLFKYSNYDDLRDYISVYFDTTMGSKRKANSYKEIALSLGIDNPSEILFVTDIYEEAFEANVAGLNVLISIREGNGELPSHNSFKTTTSFDCL